MGEIGIGLDEKSGFAGFTKIIAVFAVFSKNFAVRRLANLVTLTPGLTSLTSPLFSGVIVQSGA